MLAFVFAYLAASLMSLGGLSGALLILPFQVSVLGLTGPAITATNHLYNVVAIPGGVFRYAKEQRMLWSLTGIIVAGTFPGVLLGAYLRTRWLANPTWFKLFVGAVLVFTGSRILAKLKNPTKPLATVAEFNVRTTRLDLRQLTYTFQGDTHSVPVPPLMLLTVIVGVVGGAYGIGGGAIIAPFLVSFWRLPVHTIAGATLFGTFLTSALAVGIFVTMAHTGLAPDAMPDLVLGLTFGLGGLCGTYTGARLQRFVRPRVIEILLTLSIGGLGLSYIVGALQSLLGFRS